MASRKSSRATGGSPSPGSKRGERRGCGSEAVALQGRGGGSSGGRSRRKRRAFPAMRGSRQAKRWDAAPSPCLYCPSLPFPPAGPSGSSRAVGAGEGDAGLVAVMCHSRSRRSLSREFTWRRKLSGLGGGDSPRKLPRSVMSTGRPQHLWVPPRPLPPGDEVEQGCPSLKSFVLSYPNCHVEYLLRLTWLGQNY